MGDKVVTKAGAASESKAAGSVEAPPFALPALAAGAALSAAAIPVLLSPGEKAFEAQRQNEIGQRGRLEKGRQKIRDEGKKQWWGKKAVQQKVDKQKEKAGIFR